MKIRLSDLERMAVETEDGRRIGHLFDVSSWHDRVDEPPVAKNLLVGRAGLARRLGVGRDRSNEIDVADIVRIEEGRVIVRNRPR